MTIQEQASTLLHAAKAYSLATGNSPAAAFDELKTDPTKREQVAAGLDALAGGTSPLAAELRNLTSHQKTAKTEANAEGAKAAKAAGT